MLESIREFGNKRIVRFLFAVFLIIPFGLFGIDYYFRSPVGGDSIASVGSARIGAGELDQAVRQQAEVYRQQFRGNFDPALMENPEVKRAVLDKLIAEKLVVVGAEKAGVSIPDKVLAERIASEPFFQDNGRFSKERYEQIARSQGLTPIGLDERLRADYRQQQFRNAIAETAFVPKTSVEEFVKLSEQTREVSVVNLTPDAYLGQVKVTPDQVKAYYDTHTPEFQVPEQVRVEYVELSADALAAQTPVPEEEVKRAYEEGVQQGKFGEPEQRRASHILIAVKPDASDADRKAAEAKAKAIAEQVRKNPKSFADVAKKESQDPGSAVQGGDLGFFGKGAMVKPFEEAAFSAKKDEIIGPVKSDFGYHVIKVTDIKPAKVKSLAEATPELEAQMKKNVAQRKFAEAAENFSNLVYEQSTSLKPAADALKLKIQQSPWISRAQPSVPQLSNPKIVAEIFSNDAIKNRRNTSAVEVAPSVLVAAHVIDHKPAEQKPFDTVKADIEKKLQRDEALKLAKADGEAKLKQLQEGKDPGLKWPAALAVNRQKPGGLFPQVIDRAFRADPKKLPAYLGAETPVGYSLVKVTKVISPEKVDPAQRDQLAGRLRDAVAAEELEATLASVRNRVGVKVRKDALEKKANQ
ncbi:MAG TPA: SurA N-terminal domain-containing protein [Usitatibacter sp.]|nr:SurA N-terminal domain-containing protein [Usitatibacter sp.]